MTVYVDDPVHAYRGMLMCHMWADTMAELLAMIDAIGVQRRWLQQPPHASWVHFDISKGKRADAIRLGAVPTDRYGPVEHVCRLRIASGDPEVVLRSQQQLERIIQIRARRAPETSVLQPQGDLFA